MVGVHIFVEKKQHYLNLLRAKKVNQDLTPFPASHGLFGRPTTINNTETFAAVPWIINNGGDAYSKMGIPNNGGTKISLCLGM